MLFAFSPEKAWNVAALTEIPQSCQYLITIFASSATNPVAQRKYPELSMVRHWHNGPERLWNLHSWENTSRQNPSNLLS